MSTPTTTVTLGGVDYPIPPLGIRQLRIVMPAALALLRELGPTLATVIAMKAEAEAKLAGGGDASTSFDAQSMIDLITGLDLSTEQFEYATNILYPAIQRGTPSLTRDQFLDMEITMAELMAAVPVVLAQTGLMNPKKAGTTDAPAGSGAPGEGNQTGQSG